MSKQNKKKKGLFLFLFQWTILLSVGSIAAVIVWVADLPGFSTLAKENPTKTAFMEFREKNGIHGKPIWVPLKRIAPELKHAVIVAEDAKFYQHHGIDWKAIWNAQKRNLKERRLYRGGSTITQQLAKNLYLETSKSILRKYKEFAITIRLEQSLSKNRLLEIYLNVIEWGRGIYGAEAASRHYFGKSAEQLSLKEASWLAAILPSPLRFEKNRNSNYARKRAEWISGFVERRLKK